MSRVLLQCCTGIMMVMLSLAATSAIAAEAAETQPRLKYRAKGSVCMCASGLSEEEIRRGMAQSLLDRLQDKEQATQDLPEKDSTQPTRRNTNEDRQ